MGYKFDSGFKLQKTGIFAIDSTPSGAIIYLDDAPVKTLSGKFLNKQNFRKTPQKIKNLLPGEYNVRLELDNYWPWEKKLTIYPGQTTFAEDVIFFKKDFPIIILENFKNISYSPDKTMAISWNNESLRLIDFKNDKITTIESSGLPSAGKIKWSANSKKAILENHLIDLVDFKELDLHDLIGNKISLAQWDITESDNYIYYLNNDRLHSYNLDSKKTKPLLTEEIFQNFIIKNKKIYKISNENNSTTLGIFNLADEKLIKKINLPLSSYSFLNEENKLLNIYDTKYQTLYLIDENSTIKPLVETFKDVSNDNTWINDNELLYSNALEIWMYNQKSNEKKLITRVSNKINQILWHPKNGHIIFLANNSINVIELDNREKYNITKILELPTIENISINTEGSILYFEGIYQEKSGIYKLLVE